MKPNLQVYLSELFKGIYYVSSGLIKSFPVVTGLLVWAARQSLRKKKSGAIFSAQLSGMDIPLVVIKSLTKSYEQMIDLNIVSYFLAEKENWDRKGFHHGTSDQY